ncbi:MAG: DUF928 domain-containing protein [Oscillatoriales cyanobacterium SM2_1_8]|nr:DUF928 domain-containing protein [Oscillatoriales cyanobacterium SM2_1_8]
MFGKTTGQVTGQTQKRQVTRELSKPPAIQKAIPKMTVRAIAIVGLFGVGLGTLGPAWSVPTQAPKTQPNLPAAGASRGATVPSKQASQPASQPKIKPSQQPVALPVYVPPVDQVPPRTRGWTAGRRGCILAAEGATTIAPSDTGQSLTPLAPLHHLGKTAATHPTFVWFGEHADGAPIEFSLYAYDAERGALAAVPLYQETRSAVAGANALTLPATVAPLQSGQTYAWQVVLQPGCNVNNIHPSRNPWSRSAFQVVPSPATALTTAPSIEQMAAQGLWYDALGAAWEAGAAGQGSFVSLLNQLADLEAQQEPPEQPLVSRLSYALRRIAAHPPADWRAAIAPF